MMMSEAMYCSYFELFMKIKLVVDFLKKFGVSEKFIWESLFV